MPCRPDATRGGRGSDYGCRAGAAPARAAAPPQTRDAAASRDVLERPILVQKEVDEDTRGGRCGPRKRKVIAERPPQEDQRSDAERDCRDGEELQAFTHWMRVGAERPDAIEIPVGDAARHKPDREIRNPRKRRRTALDAVRDDEVYDGSARAHRAELDELPDAPALRDVKQPSTNPQTAPCTVRAAAARRRRWRCWRPAARPRARRSRTSGTARGQSAACSSGSRSPLAPRWRAPCRRCTTA